MPRVVLTETSREDIVQILLYLRQRSRQGARRVHQSIHHTLSLLSEHPNFGQNRIDFGPGIRSFPGSRYRHYLIFYRAISDGIEVLRVLHGSRNLPDEFG